jgi:hypothetical protein
MDKDPMSDSEIEGLVGRLGFHGRHGSETQQECAVRKNAEREEAASALRQLMEERGCRDMASAPTDGTRILIDLARYVKWEWIEGGAPAPYATGSEQGKADG